MIRSPKTRETQRAVIKEALLKGIKISSMWGFRQGIVRLTNRVNELKKSGLKIKSKWKYPNPENKVGRYKEYFMEV